MRFKGSRTAESGLNFSTGLDWRLGQPSSLYFRGEYRRTDYEIDKGEGLLLEAGFKYRVRETQLSLVTRYVDEEFEQASDQRLFYAMITFKRFF